MFISEGIEHFEVKNPFFTCSDVIKLIKANPELQMINNNVKRTNILNVVTDEIDPDLWNAKVYFYQELNCNDVDLEWDIDRVVDNLKTISVIIYQELNTDIRGNPNY